MLHVLDWYAFYCVATFAVCLRTFLVQDGMKPIHFASIQGSISMFKVLTKLGSDPKSPTRNVRMNK